jgi:hypothetical protein
VGGIISSIIELPRNWQSTNLKEGSIAAGEGRSLYACFSIYARLFVGQRLRLSCVPATSVHPRFPPTHLNGQTHVRKWGCPASQGAASERGKRTLWLVAATRLVCPLLSGRSCGRQRYGVMLRSSGMQKAITLKVYDNIVQ